VIGYSRRHPSMRILVLPMGDNIREEIIKIIAGNLQAQLGLPVDVLPIAPIPDSAYNPKRGQYNALTLLKEMQKSNRPSDSKLLGIVNVDIFIPILTHVFGEAQLDQACAVISLWRLENNNDGSKASPSDFFERSAKLAVHELAHTFNIRHCREENCIMKYMPTIEALDAQDLILCRYCSLDLEEKLTGNH
jgi:archaemetzincin